MIGMNFAFLLPLVTSEILTRNESGTAFARTDEKTYFYMDSKSVKLNILRPSPRSLLKADDYSQCNRILNDYCDQLFNTFDEEIMAFLSLNLVEKKLESVNNDRSSECPTTNPFPYFSGEWCCASNQEKEKPSDEKSAKKWGMKNGDGSCDGTALSMDSKCCKGSTVRCENPPCKASKMRKTRRIHPHAEIQLEHRFSTPPNSTSEQATLPRSRRAIPLVAQFIIVVVLAISAYFIGEAVMESEIDNVQADIFKQEQALKSLTNAVEFDHEGLNSVVRQLRVDSELVLSPNVSSIPAFYAYLKAKTIHEDFDPSRNVRKYQRFYPNHISQFSLEESRAFEQNVLQLQNNRLPLNKNFLLALRAKCLAVQTISSALAQTFCNDLAFHATRWDTGLKFEGIGFEFNENKKFKSTVYSMEIQIPILYDGGLTEYDIINLGRFQSANTIRKIPLPVKAVITAAGDIRPLNDKNCIRMNTYKVCPKHAIGPFSSCLQSVYDAQISADCPVIDVISPSTCTSQVIGNAMAISMFKNGTMHYDLGNGDLLIKPEQVESFTILRRKTTRGTLFCMQSKHRHITPDLVLPSIMENSDAVVEILSIPNFHDDLEHLQPLSMKLDSVETQLSKARHSLNVTKDLLAESKNHTSSVMAHFKKHVEDAENTVDAKISSVYYGIIYKIALPILLAGLIILLVWKLLKRNLKSCCIGKPTAPTDNLKQSFRTNHEPNNREDSPMTTSSI